MKTTIQTGIQSRAAGLTYRLLVAAAPPEVLNRTYQTNIIIKSEKT